MQQRGLEVAEQMTAIEFKYQDIRAKYEEDVKGLIDTKLLLAEAQMRVADLEEALEKATVTKVRTLSSPFGSRLRLGVGVLMGKIRERFPVPLRLFFGFSCEC